MFGLGIIRFIARRREVRSSDQLVMVVFGSTTPGLLSSMSSFFGSISSSILNCMDNLFKWSIRQSHLVFWSEDAKHVVHNVPLMRHGKTSGLAIVFDVLEGLRFCSIVSKSAAHRTDTTALSTRRAIDVCPKTASNHSQAIFGQRVLANLGSGSFPWMVRWRPSELWNMRNNSFVGVCYGHIPQSHAFSRRVSGALKKPIDSYLIVFGLLG